MSYLLSVLRTELLHMASYTAYLYTRYPTMPSTATSSTGMMSAVANAQRWPVSVFHCC